MMSLVRWPVRAIKTSKEPTMLSGVARFLRGGFETCPQGLKTFFRAVVAERL